jgi:hypothetical protein
MTAPKPGKKPSKNKGKARTSLWLTQDALKASAKKAAKLGLTRGLYLEQLIRRDTGLGVGVALDEQPSVFG